MLREPAARLLLATSTAACELPAGGGARRVARVFAFVPVLGLAEARPRRQEHLLAIVEHEARITRVLGIDRHEVVIDVAQRTRPTIDDDALDHAAFGSAAALCSS